MKDGVKIEVNESGPPQDFEKACMRGPVQVQEWDGIPKVNSSLNYMKQYINSIKIMTGNAVMGNTIIEMECSLHSDIESLQLRVINNKPCS